MRLAARRTTPVERMTRVDQVPLTRGALAGLAALALVATMGGCDDEEKPKATAGSSTVCGFFSKSEVATVVGSQDFPTEGSGMVPAARRRTDTADYVVLAQDTINPSITAMIAELSERRTATEVRHTLATEASKPGCQGSQSWPGLGSGNVCQRGNTTAVAALTTRRLIRVELTGRTGSDHPAVETAVALAREADSAATSFDAAGS